MEAFEALKKELLEFNLVIYIDGNKGKKIIEYKEHEKAKREKSLLNTLIQFSREVSNCSLDELNEVNQEIRTIYWHTYYELNELFGKYAPNGYPINLSKEKLRDYFHDFDTFNFMNDLDEIVATPEIAPFQYQKESIQYDNDPTILWELRFFIVSGTDTIDKLKNILVKAEKRKFPKQGKISKRILEKHEIAAALLGIVNPYSLESLNASNTKHVVFYYIKDVLKMRSINAFEAIEILKDTKGGFSEKMYQNVTLQIIDYLANIKQEFENIRDEPVKLPSSQFKLTAKLAALTYLLELDLEGKQLPTSDGGLAQKEIDRFGLDRFQKSSFTKAVRDVLNYDRNSKKDLKQLSNNWKQIVLNNCKDKQEMEKYLSSKQL